MPRHLSDDPEKRARSLQNLRLWQPGIGPNPNGERGPLITPRMRYLLSLTIAQFAAWRPRPAGDQVAYRLVLEAMGGSAISERGRQEVIDRIDGKVVEKIEVWTEPPAIAALKALKEAVEGRTQ